VAYFKDLGGDVNIFFVESRWLRSSWVEPILRRTGKRSYRLHRLASTDFFNQIKRLAFFSAAPRNPVSAAADAYFTDPMPAWQVLFVTFCAFGQNTGRQKR
jgi:hypothetical protein